MQSRYSWKFRRTGYVRFSSLDQNKMSDYWVYDLKSCRSYMIRVAAFWVTNGCTSISKPITTLSTPMGVDNDEINQTN